MRKLLLHLFLSLSFVGLAHAQEDEVFPEKTMEEKFIESNIAISEWFDGVADGIDLFLVGKKRISTKKNATTVKIENSTIWNEGEGLNNLSGLGVNLRLPNLEEYWQLKFTTYDERKENRGVDRSYLRRTQREKNYGTTIGFFRKLGDIRTAFQPRIEFQETLKLSQSLSFESVGEYQDVELNPKLEFYANPGSGTGIFWALYLNKILSKTWSFTLINDGDYQDKAHLHSVSNGFSFGQSLSDKYALSYNYIVYSNNKPSYHLQGYSVFVTWTHLIYKRILDYQFTPMLNFDKDTRFKGKAGVNFTVTLTF